MTRARQPVRSKNRRRPIEYLPMPIPGLLASWLRRPVWLWVLLLIPLGIGIARLRFDVEILHLLPRQLPVVEGLKLYQEHFSDARELVVTIDATSAEAASSTARALARVLRAETNLVAALNWQPAWIEHPAEATELVAYLWLNQPAAVLDALEQRLAPTNLPVLLADARDQLATSFSPQDIARQSYDPFSLLQLPDSHTGSVTALGSGDQLFAASEGRFRLLFVEARPDLASYRACRTWLAEIRQLVARMRETAQIPDDVRIQFTGRPAFVTEIASGMETDMSRSAGGTLLVIGLLFWLAHRRLRPLAWLLAILIAILAGTTALGGLVLGTISIVSLGFAAILLGLAEDFGILTYQESRSHPLLDVRQLRSRVAPGIFWSAVTTAGAFLILNLSTLPGLAQLGTLVALGITLAAVLMLYGYLPAILRLRPRNDAEDPTHLPREKSLRASALAAWLSARVWIVSLSLAAACLAVLWHQGVQFDHSPNVLKPKQSEAGAALEQIQTRFGQLRDPLWVLTPGRDEAEVARRLTRVREILDQALTRQQIAGYTLPTVLWPDPANQAANRPVVARLVARQEALEGSALEAGFTTNALAATRQLLETWRCALASTHVFWPTNPTSRHVLGKVMARSNSGYLALGLVHATPNLTLTQNLARDWPADCRQAGILLSGWELLGSTVFDTVVRELPRVVLPILGLVVLSLWLAFRNLREVGLSLAALAFTALLLAAAMGALGWSWNLLNLMAVPLLLGMGVDFSIHMQLALRRHHGDHPAVHRSVGRALRLAGVTTAVGFGSLGLSSNTGMASLGKVCALGILLALAVAVYLLPTWWRTARRNSIGEVPSASSRPGERRNATAE